MIDNLQNIHVLFLLSFFFFSGMAYMSLLEKGEIDI